MPSPSALPGLPDIGKTQPLKRLRKPPLRSTGPRVLRLQKDPDIIGGPGEPPEGFVTAHTSKTEWVVYWGFSKVTRQPRDPRKGPYIGAPGLWEYQKAVDGGRVIGGQVVDFVYFHSRGQTLGFRIQTERWHIFTDADKQMSDFFLKEDQRAVDQIVDLFDYEWLWDKTGKAVCAAIANGIKGIQSYSPIFAGTSQRIRGGIH